MSKFSWITMMWTVKRHGATKTNVVPNHKWFLFWTFLYFPQITLWKYPSEGLVITAFQCWHLYLSQKKTWFRNCLIWFVNAITMCSKVVYNVTAKMLWPISLGRSGSQLQLFVASKWINRAIRSCIIDFFFIFRGRYFENGLVGVKYGQIFIVKIIISYKDPTRLYKLFQVSH